MDGSRYPRPDGVIDGSGKSNTEAVIGGLQLLATLSVMPGGGPGNISRGVTEYSERACFRGIEVGIGRRGRVGYPPIREA